MSDPGMNRWQRLRIKFDYDIKHQGDYLMIEFIIKHGSNKIVHKIQFNIKDYLKKG